MDRFLAAIVGTVSTAVGLVLRVVLGLFAVALAISVALSALIIGGAVAAWALLRGRKAGPIRFAWAGSPLGGAGMRAQRAPSPSRPASPVRVVRGEVVDVEAREVPESERRP